MAPKTNNNCSFCDTDLSEYRLWGETRKDHTGEYHELCYKIVGGN